MVESINRKLKGWAVFYQFVDHKAKIFSYIDGFVFWKLTHWLGHKYRSRLKPLMRHWFNAPASGQSTSLPMKSTNKGLIIIS